MYNSVGFRSFGRTSYLKPLYFFPFHFPSLPFSFNIPSAVLSLPSPSLYVFFHPFLYRFFSSPSPFSVIIPSCSDSFSLPHLLFFSAILFLLVSPFPSYLLSAIPFLPSFISFLSPICNSFTHLPPLFPFYFPSAVIFVFL